MKRYFSAERIGVTLFPAFKGVMTSPNDYFAAMPQATDYRDSLMLLGIYLGLSSLVSGIVAGVMSLILILPLSLILGFIGTWTWAWYLGWAARRFCGAQLSTVDAFQICAYSSAPLIFSWIPIIGVVAWLSNLYLNWQGLVSYARLGAGAALLIILGYFLILLLSIVVLVVLLAYASTHYGVNLPYMTPPTTWL